MLAWSSVSGALSLLWGRAGCGFCSRVMGSCNPPKANLPVLTARLHHLLCNSVDSWASRSRSQNQNTVHRKMHCYRLFIPHPYTYMSLYQMCPQIPASCNSIRHVSILMTLHPYVLKLQKIQAVPFDSPLQVPHLLNIFLHS